MVAINTALISDVKEFLDNGDRAFLTHLQMSPRDDIESQAVVRYLMQIKHWPFTPDSGFSLALEHLFTDHPERKARDPQEYRETTFALIKASFGYECIEVVAEPKPEPKLNPGKVTRRPKMVAEKDDLGGSQDEPVRSKGKSSLDTTGASDRLKKVIDIQRG